MYRRCVLAALRIVKFGLTKVGNQAKLLKYSKKKCIPYHIRADVQKYGHRPRYTSDNDEAETEVAYKSASLLPDGFSCLSNKRNEILFRINISPPLTTIVGLYGVGQWLGLSGHRTSHQLTSSYEVTLKP
jgi:hypothetical protein